MVKVTEGMKERISCLKLFLLILLLKKVVDRMWNFFENLQKNWSNMYFTKASDMQTP